MPHAAALASFVLGASLAGGALAADAERYRLEKSETGYVRMDTQTGEMSICEERDSQLVCRLAADERSAFQMDVDRLERDVKALESRVDRLENSLAARFEESLPTEEEFEKTMGYVERFFRGIIGIVKDLEEEDAGKLPAPTERERT